MWTYLTFIFYEAITYLWRSRGLNILSVGAIMFAMFILGSFLFVGVNLKAITISWQEQIQFNVFLKENLSQSELQAVQVYLEESFFVDRVIFISKAEAKQRFEGDFEAYAEASMQLNENPFPASFQVSLMKGIGKDSYEKLKTDLLVFAGIEDIYYDEEIFKRLNLLAGLIQAAGWFFGGIMIFSSIFTISNVLKLTFFTRREEVDIMKLVGASRSFIRGPFIVEGVLIGAIGACFGVLLVFFGHVSLSYYLKSHPEFFVSSSNLMFLPLSWSLLLIFSGALSGLLGSLVSLTQFLEEHISYQ